MSIILKNDDGLNELIFRAMIEPGKVLMCKNKCDFHSARVSFRDFFKIFYILHFYFLWLKDWSLMDYKISLNFLCWLFGQSRGPQNII